MKDIHRHLEKLRDEASACAMIASEATDKMKRDLFVKLSQHFSMLADQVEQAIAKGQE